MVVCILYPVCLFTVAGLLTVKYNIIGHYEYRGLHLTKGFMSKERIEAFEHYDNFNPDDVVLLTYPKTGNVV